jgi:putative protease
MPGKEIGKITHYFPKVGVAVLDLTAPLKVGEKIRVERHDGSFTQEVSSMQIEHAQVTEAKPGQSIGLKVNERVHEGNKVFLEEG